MTISYTFDKKAALKGLSRSEAYRRPIRRFLLPVLGLIFIAYSSRYLPSDESGSSIFGILLLFLGITYLILPVFVRRRAVNNIFAGRSGEMVVKVTTFDEGLEMSTEDSSAMSSWSSLVDFRICEDGILLYPQKMLQYWIPNIATVEGGTWQGFEELISRKIERKI